MDVSEVQTTSDPRVASLRSNRRSAQCQRRVDHRWKNFERSRPDLKSIASSFEPPSRAEFTELVQRLMKRNRKNVTPDEMKSILQRIRNCIGNGTEMYANAFLAVDGSLQALVGFLSGTDAGCSLESMLIVANLLLCNDERKLWHVVTSTIHYVAVFLQSGSSLVQDASAWTLGNMAGLRATEEKRLVSYLKEFDFACHLMPLLYSTNDNVIESTCYALGQLLTSVDCQWTTLKRPDDMETVARGVLSAYNRKRDRWSSSTRESGNDDELMWLLFVVSCSPAGARELTNNDRLIVRHLYDDLHTIAVDTQQQQQMQTMAATSSSQQQHFDVQRCTSLLRSLANLVAVAAECGLNVVELLFDDQQQHPQQTQFIQLVDSLVNSPYPHVRHESMWLIGNLVKCDRRLIELIGPVLERSPTI